MKTQNTNDQTLKAQNDFKCATFSPDIQKSIPEDIRSKMAEDREASHSEILSRIAMVVSRHAPDGVCETEEIVRHLCRIAEGARLAKSELERIRADKLAQLGLGDEATALSCARQRLAYA